MAPDFERIKWSNTIPSSTISPRFKQCLILTPLWHYFPRTSYNNSLQPDYTLPAKMDIFSPNDIVVHYFHDKRSFYTKPKGVRDSTIFGPYPGEIWHSHILLIEIWSSLSISTQIKPWNHWLVSKRRFTVYEWEYTLQKPARLQGVQLMRRHTNQYVESFATLFFSYLFTCIIKDILGKANELCRQWGIPYLFANITWRKTARSKPRRELCGVVWT